VITDLDTKKANKKFNQKIKLEKNYREKFKKIYDGEKKCVEK
tara:strand:- start:629 stop:754 length:126 start_codon:yes stop_codon:yes gene_type:complete